MIGVLVWVLASAAAWGQDGGLKDRIARLEALVAAQQKTIAALESRLDALKRPDKAADAPDGVALSARQEKATTKADAGQDGAQADYRVKINPGLTVTDADSGESISIRGMLQTDLAFFKDDRRDFQDDAAFRRARIDLRGRLNPDISFRVESDFSLGRARIVNGYARWQPGDHSRLTIGQQKPRADMAFNTSSRERTFDIAGVNATLLPRHRIGAQVEQWGRHHTLSAGLFAQDSDKDPVADEGLMVAGRAVWRPVVTPDARLHLGVNVLHQDVNGDVFRLRTRPVVRLSRGDRLIDTGTLAGINRTTTWGAELAGALGPVTWQGEWKHMDIDRDGAGSGLSADGGYGQVGIFLTGEHRPYSNTAGVFGKVIPNQSLADGGPGALEMVVRYHELDLFDGPAMPGGVMSDWTLGLNWFLTRSVRFMANYSFIQSRDPLTGLEDDPEVLLLRTAVHF